MAAALRAADMAGDALVIMEGLDHPVGEPHIHAPPDQRVRHRVEGPVDLDMVVGMHLRRFPLRIFERRRERRQSRPLDLLEQFAAAFADMAHGAVVQILQQHRDCDIEIAETEEAPVAQPGQEPALDDQHRALDLALVARLAASGRQDRRVVMFGHGGEGLVERRLEPQLATPPSNCRRRSPSLPRRRR
ncbi:hypothetical protein [Mesorhizobium sp. L103C105A0]|uniref:hypothetical protein n=1 Tax=Mesorhizobium sp. L103C105A0 TaxID=1287074 RepID=UPI001FD8D87B|nr:hypothetical protein [Mesorhizobium sp. L103C105A0]